MIKHKPKSLLISGALLGAMTLAFAASPYPPSKAIADIIWHWETHATAAPGSDLWPVTWGPDDRLYAAWGDGGGFGGTDSDGRVAMGFACGFPQNWMSADGLTLWSIFSVYGDGAKIGIKAHDRFNLVKASLKLREP